MQYCDDCARLIASVIGPTPLGSRKAIGLPPNALISYIKRPGDCEYCGGPGPCNGTHSSKIGAI